MRYIGIVFLGVALSVLHVGCKKERPDAASGYNRNTDGASSPLNRVTDPRIADDQTKISDRYGVVSSVRSSSASQPSSAPTSAPADKDKAGDAPAKKDDAAKPAEPKKDKGQPELPGAPDGTN